MASKRIILTALASIFSMAVNNPGGHLYIIYTVATPSAFERGCN